MSKELTKAEVDRIIGMAWEDRTTFDVIKDQFGVSESEVIKIMRANMKTSSFKMWRERVHGRKTKHRALANENVARFVSPDQRHRDKTG
ncbi:MAG: TIGR03643 family protein [Acidobacteriota bacterium]|nr:TIGR03643 family protein [Acidobacteriota bacterium]